MTLLLKNVRVLGSARTFAESADVFINDETISAIGDFSTKQADVVLDGEGAYLSPGFIDVNTDSDHYLTLFDYPGQEDFLRQGVTTIMGGMCGSSLAPLIYGTLESVRKWGGENRINVDWHTMAEFLATLDRRPLAVNFGTLVGHSTVRRSIVGDSIRDLTKNEMNVLLFMLKQALAEGAFGISTGLGYVHAYKTSYNELKNIASMVKGVRGIYATHLRMTGKGIAEAVEETIKLADETDANTLISHFVPLTEAKEEYEKALERIEALPAERNLHFDIYPFESMLLPLYTFLPQWAKTGPLEAMLTSVNDAWLAGRIKKDIERVNPDHFFVAQAPGNDVFVGKSLKDIQEMYEIKDVRDALLQFMKLTNLRGSILYRNLDSTLIRRGLKSSRSLIASNAPSFGKTGPFRQMRSERTTSTFMTFLTLAERDGLLPLDEAIRKVTMEPAKKFGLSKRGEIKEGNIADLTCFKNGEVRFTIVGGKVAMKNGVFENIFPGKTLRRSSARA